MREQSHFIFVFLFTDRSQGQNLKADMAGQSRRRCTQDAKLSVFRVPAENKSALGDASVEKPESKISKNTCTPPKNIMIKSFKIIIRLKHSHLTNKCKKQGSSYTNGRDVFRQHESRKPGRCKHVKKRQ